MAQCPPPQNTLLIFMVLPTLIRYRLLAIFSFLTGFVIGL